MIRNTNEPRNRNDDSELPGISGTNHTDTIEGVQTTTSSPLLFLLDGVLSRYEARVAEAMNIILYEYKVIINITTSTNAATTTNTASVESTQICRRGRDFHSYQDYERTLVEHRDSIQKQQQDRYSIDGIANFSSTLSPDDDSPTHYSHYGIESPCTSSISLCIVINALLNQYPHLAHIPSDHDGSLPLHFAASLGNVPAAMAILQKFPQAATKTNQKGKIPLHYAAREGRIDMVKYFLCVCPETSNIATDKGKLAIHFAAGDGHAEITSILLQAYPKSAAISSHKGKLPLHFCARWGYMEIAHELISVYPNAVRALDWEGSLPLHDAAREGEYTMAKYLMNQYPHSLQTANLRGEIPLFPAIRSSNINLITLMIQSWPMSGKHVLRNISVDDHISSWHWKIVELLLRGATHNFYQCTLLENHEPPTFCLMDDIHPPITTEGTSNALEEWKAQKKTRKAAAVLASASRRQDDVAVFGTAADSAFPAVGMHIKPCIPVSAYASVPQVSRNVYNSTQRFATNRPNPACVWNTTSYYDMPLSAVPAAPLVITSSLKISSVPVPSSSTSSPPAKVRCKSPILELKDDQKMSCKRPRNMIYPTVSDQINHPSQRRTFIPMHAAFECKASYQVIERVLEERPYDVHRLDDMNRNLLHYAVAHCRNDAAVVDLVLQRKNYILSSKTVRVIDPTTGRLPIHIAIANNANISIILALIQEYPTSGIAPCRTPDEFYDKTPIHMATQYKCDLSTVYELLRIDPSFVIKSRL